MVIVLVLLYTVAMVTLGAAVGFFIVACYCIKASGDLLLSLFVVVVAAALVVVQLFLAKVVAEVLLMRDPLIVASCFRDQIEKT